MHIVSYGPQEKPLYLRIFEGQFGRNLKNHKAQV